MKNTNTLKFYSSNEPARGFLGDEGQSPSFNRLHQGVLQVGKISLLIYKCLISCLFTIEARGKNSPGAPMVLY